MYRQTVQYNHHQMVKVHVIMYVDGKAVL